MNTKDIIVSVIIVSAFLAAWFLIPPYEVEMEPDEVRFTWGGTP